MSSFLSFWLLWWHSSTKCNHSFKIYLFMKIVLSIFTFSWWCQVHLRQVSRTPCILVFAFLANNNWKELVRLSKNITLQCIEHRPFKDIQQRHTCQAWDITPSKSYSMLTLQDIQKLSLQNFALNKKKNLWQTLIESCRFESSLTRHNQTKVYVINTNKDCTNYLNPPLTPC